MNKEVQRDTFTVSTPHTPHTRTRARTRTHKRVPFKVYSVEEISVI